MIVSIWGTFDVYLWANNQLHPPCFSEYLLSAFCRTTQEQEFYQICDWCWNINNLLAYLFFFFFWEGGVNLGPFCSNLVKIEFSWKTGLRQFLNIPIIYNVKFKKKTNELFMKKMLNWWMDRQTDNSDLGDNRIFKWPFTSKQFS